MTRARAPLIAVTLALAVVGCRGLRDRDARRHRHDASLVPIVNRADAPVGVGVVVRATYDRVLLALAPPPDEDERLFLALGDERVAASVRVAGAVALLEAARGAHDLRPLLATEAGPLGEDSPLLLVGVTREPALATARAAVEGLADDGGLALASSAEGLVGAVALTPMRSLVGFVMGDDEEERAQVLPVARVLPAILARACELPGASMLYPEDGFLTYAVSVPREFTWRELPRVEDEWGDPDLFVALEQDRVPLTRLEITPARGDPGEHLITLHRRSPLTARLVERDLTLTGGERGQEMAEPILFDPLGPEVALPFRLHPEVLEQVGAAADASGAHPGPFTSAQVVLGLEPIDPERDSSFDRAPLGANRLALRRVGADTVDLSARDATDFWLVAPDPLDEQGGAPERARRRTLLALFYRHRPAAGITVEAFSPARGDPLWRTEGDSPRHLLVARLERVPEGPLLLRVRHWGARPGPCPYSVLLFPADDEPAGLLRALFRLVGLEAGRSRAPFLGSREFARELFQALVTELGLEREALGEAVLEALGDRTREVRHLALHLLEVYVPPPIEVLERIRRLRRPGAAAVEDRRRALDAGLLLALRIASARDFRDYLPVFVEAARDIHPDRYPASALTDSRRLQRVQQEALAALHATILAAARDGDQRIRLRALAAAARFAGSNLLGTLGGELRALLADDPSLAVRRALETAFPG